MSLTLEQRQKLSDKGFDILLARHKAVWVDVTQQAYRFYRHLWGADAKIRPEDLSILVDTAVKTTDAYRSFVDRKQIAAKHWAKWFADLIVEELYTPTFIAEEEKRENGNYE